MIILLLVVVGVVVSVGEFLYAVQIRRELREHKVGGLARMWARHMVRDELLSLVILVAMMIPIIVNVFLLERQPSGGGWSRVSRVSMGLVPIAVTLRVVMKRRDRSDMEEEAAALIEQNRSQHGANDFLERDTRRGN